MVAMRSTSFTIMFSESICQYWCKILILLLMLALMPWIIIWKHALNWPLLCFLFFIWLCSVLVVACGLCDLHYSMGGLLSCGMRTLSCGMWDILPEQGLNLGHLHWDYRVLATGPPGKSHNSYTLNLSESLKNKQEWTKGKNPN